MRKNILTAGVLSFLLVVPLLIVSADSVHAASAPASQDSFTVSAASGTAPLVVTFTGTINASGSCAASAYTFGFGDNTARQVDVIANTCAPQTFSFTHTYVAPGAHSIDLWHASLLSITEKINPGPILQTPPVVTVTGSTSVLMQPNPAYAIDPTVIFPSKSALLPNGIIYTDTVPATLDLAERASSYINGATQAILPDEYDAVAGYQLEPQSPFTCEDGSMGKVCLFSNAQDWGMVMLGLARAREMSGYDRSDAAGTLSTQYTMMQNMLNWGVQSDSGAKFGADILQNPNGFPANLSVAMQSLIAEWQDHPTQALSDAINQFVLMHYDNLATTTDPVGNTYWGFEQYTDPGPNTFQGYYGHSTNPFVSGIALRALEEWNIASSDSNPISSAVSSELSMYVRNYDHSVFWISPDPSLTSIFPFSPGTGFAGHEYSFLQPIMGLLLQAQDIGTSTSLGLADIKFSNTIYNFIKARTKAGLIGDFGEYGTLDSMITSGIQLSEMGQGDYYDEIDAWTRNQLAEGQIDAATAQNYIQNNSTGVYSTDHIANKVTGLFFADATHILAIPDNSAGGSDDYPSNAMHSLYEVWLHIIDISGNSAQVNFLLNRAGEYMDVKSDIPYRGRVEIDTKQSLGSITDLLVHIPNWTTKAKVAVSVENPDGSLTALQWTWGGPYGDYAHITGLKPNTAYIVTFPIVTTTQTIYQERDQNTIWYEGDYPGTGSIETDLSYQGTFRGDTLVAATPLPSGGIPRYNEPYRQALAALGTTEAAPPIMTVSRFVYNGDANAIPNIPIPAPAPSPAVSLTVNGSAQLSIARGTHYTIAWSSQGVTGCTLSWVTADPTTGASGSNTETPDVAASSSAALIGSYTFTCQSSAGAKSATATVTSASIPVPLDSFSASPATGPAPLAVGMTGLINAAASCAASAYTISFGDSQAKEFDIPANACASQPLSLTHTYANPGSYNVVLYKGTIAQVQQQSGSTSIGGGTVIATAATSSTPLTAPTNLAVSCNTAGTSAAFSWSPASGASTYLLRFLNTATNVQTSLDTAGASTYTAAVTSGVAYQWWILSANSATGKTSSTVLGANFTCTAPVAPLPVPVSATLSYVSQGSQSINVSYTNMSAASQMLFVNVTSGQRYPPQATTLSGNGTLSVPFGSFAAGTYYLLALDAKGNYLAQTVAFTLAGAAIVPAPPLAGSATCAWTPVSGSPSTIAISGGASACSAWCASQDLEIDAHSGCVYKDASSTQVLADARLSQVASILVAFESILNGLAALLK